AHQVLVRAHAPGDAVHDDPKTLFGHGAVPFFSTGAPCAPPLPSNAGSPMGRTPAIIEIRQRQSLVN
ncbi:MAG: hypothetical protein MI741_13365, partial [Rhodospirillales bacterium]|nr:hypothetical protein [Rhodospirillales bacterium]